uniref:Uncharacterized protein n=1 Tax=Arion vulgaris TaxID=1028688 RepID=A0A0B7A6G5_9EUPU
MESSEFMLSCSTAGSGSCNLLFISLPSLLEGSFISNTSSSCIMDIFLINFSDSLESAMTQIGKTPKRDLYCTPTPNPSTYEVIMHINLRNLKMMFYTEGIKLQ